MKIIAFFSNRESVGTTSLVYHLAWMFAELGVSVLAVDLDPQANLTAMFLSEEERTGGLTTNRTDGLRIEPKLSLLPSDLGLSRFEENLSQAWCHCSNSSQLALDVVTFFHRRIQGAAEGDSELALIDLGPNLGAINRSALIAADYVCFPLTADRQSLQGLRHAGPALTDWRNSWEAMKSKAPEGLPLPRGSMAPAGYVLMQQGAGTRKEDIPGVYQEAVLGISSWFSDVPKLAVDPHCLARLRHYRSLMPLAAEARKPMFLLTPVDGAIGAHGAAVQDCLEDFLALAERIAVAVGVTIG